MRTMTLPTLHRSDRTARRTCKGNRALDLECSGDGQSLWKLSMPLLCKYYAEFLFMKSRNLSQQDGRANLLLIFVDFALPTSSDVKRA